MINISELTTELKALNPEDRIKAADQAIEECRQAMAELGLIKATAVGQLLREGISQAQLAKNLGITRQRIGQIRDLIQRMETQVPLAEAAREAQVQDALARFDTHKDKPLPPKT